jgi:hypothetical protein
MVLLLDHILNMAPWILLAFESCYRSRKYQTWEKGLAFPYKLSREFITNSSRKGKLTFLDKGQRRFPLVGTFGGT